jgi:hypothetical protein
VLGQSKCRVVRSKERKGNSCGSQAETVRSQCVVHQVKDTIEARLNVGQSKRQNAVAPAKSKLSSHREIRRSNRIY